MRSPYDGGVQHPTGSSWPPPSPSAPPPAAPSAPAAPAARPSGWYEAGDGRWYETDIAPAPGWWLASDLRWYPPGLATWVPDAGSPGGWSEAEPWRASRWGLGDAWWGLLVYIVASIALGFLLLFGMTLIDPDTAFEDVEFGAYAVSIGLLANVLAFAGIPWIASKRKGLASLADDFGLRFRALDLLIGFGLGIGALIVAGITAVAVDSALDVEDTTSNIPVDDLTSPGQVIVFFLAVAIITPIIEELFFRGLLLRSLRKRGMGTVSTLLITTIVFVLPHLIAELRWPNILVLFAVITVYGTVFHLACILTDHRLGAPIVAHMVVNGTAVIVLMLS